MTIKRVTLRDQILDGLKSIIENYSIGDRLPSEQELSETLGVSRNSIREAMKSLAIAGIVRPQAGKGTFLLRNIGDPNRTADDIIGGIDGVLYKDLIEIRSIIEVEAAGLAASRSAHQNASIGQFTRAWENLKEVLESGDNKNTEVGREFHRELSILTGNKLLVRILDNLSEENEKLRELTIEKGDTQKELKIHEEIYKAVKNHDVDGAKDAMKAHMIYTAEVYNM